MGPYCNHPAYLRLDSGFYLECWLRKEEPVILNIISLILPDPKLIKSSVSQGYSVAFKLAEREKSHSTQLIESETKSLHTRHTNSRNYTFLNLRDRMTSSNHCIHSATVCESHVLAANVIHISVSFAGWWWWLHSNYLATLGQVHKSCGAAASSLFRLHFNMQDAYSKKYVCILCSGPYSQPARHLAITCGNSSAPLVIWTWRWW